MTLLKFELCIFVCIVAYCMWKYFYEGFFYRLCIEEMQFTKALFDVTRCNVEKCDVLTQYHLEFKSNVSIEKKRLLDIELQLDGFINEGVVELRKDGDAFVPYFNRDKLKVKMYETIEAAAARIADYQNEDLLSQIVLGRTYQTLFEQYTAFEKRYWEVCRIQPGENFSYL